jgi:hypothetical protein
MLTSALPPGHNAESCDEFLSRFGDAIDDRVAELLPEILREQEASFRRSRLSPWLVLAGLLIALAASIVLHRSVLAVCVVWAATAVACLAAARFPVARRP